MRCWRWSSYSSRSSSSVSRVVRNYDAFLWIFDVFAACSFLPRIMFRQCMCVWVCPGVGLLRFLSNVKHPVRASRWGSTFFRRNWFMLLDGRFSLLVFGFRFSGDASSSCHAPAPTWSAAKNQRCPRRKKFMHFHWYAKHCTVWGRGNQRPSKMKKRLNLCARFRFR